MLSLACLLLLFTRYLFILFRIGFSLLIGEHNFLLCFYEKGQQIGIGYLDYSKKCLVVLTQIWVKYEQTQMLGYEMSFKHLSLTQWLSLSIFDPKMG